MRKCNEINRSKIIEKARVIVLSLSYDKNLWRLKSLDEVTFEVVFPCISPAGMWLRKVKVSSNRLSFSKDPPTL